MQIHHQNGLTTASRGNSTAEILCVAALFVAVSLAAYLLLSRGLPGAFLIDDSIRIEGKEINSLDLDSLSRAIASTDVGILGRPVSLASLFVTKYLHGNSPAHFKHENILLHLITGFLVFWFIYRLFRSSNLERWASTEKQRLTYAGITATLWLLHPLHVSTVLYAVQRMTILSALFTFAALLAYVAGRQIAARSVYASLGPYAWFALFGVLAIFSKEDAALLPVYVLILELVIFRFAYKDKRERNHLIVLQSIVVVIPIVIASAYLLTHLESLLYDYAVRDFNLIERMFTQTIIMWRYVFMLVLPQLSQMSLYHDSVEIFTFTSPLAWTAAIAWLSVIITASTFWRKQPILAVGIGIYLCSHFIESTFLPLELMFEHRNYFGSFGLMLIICHAILYLYKNVSVGPYISTSFTLALVLLLGFQTGTRAAAWSNEELLLRVTLSDHPGSDRAASALANIYLKQGRIRLARNVLRKGIDTPPHRGQAGLRMHLLGTYCVGDDPAPEPLYDNIVDDLATRPTTAYILSGLKVISDMKRKDRCDNLDTVKVLALFETAAANPASRKSNKFQINYLTAEELLNAGEYSRAESYYIKALSFSDSVPNSTLLRCLISLADVQIHLDKIDDARNTVAQSTSVLDSMLLEHPGLQFAVNNQIEALEDLQENKNPDS